MLKRLAQMILQRLLEYTRIAWDIANREVDKEAISTDPTRDYDKMWESHELLYHRDSSTRTIHWNTRVPNLGLVIIVSHLSKNQSTPTTLYN